MAAKFFGRERYGLTLCPPLRNAAADQEHAQRGDEWGDTCERDKCAVDAPDEGAERKTDKYWHNNRQIKRPSAENRLWVQLPVYQLCLGK